MKLATFIIPVCALAAFAGCVGKRPSNPAATQPVTNIDPQLADPNHWLSQPATHTVTSNDFNRLWETCEGVSRDFLFSIDRRDQRSGLLTTHPVISKQFFEFWRRDAGTSEDVKEASLASIRRSIHFRFAQNTDGTYTVAPKVLVERQSKIEAKYRAEAEGPLVYWYALRRDHAMEEKLAEAIRRRLQPPAQVAGE